MSRSARLPLALVLALAVSGTPALSPAAAATQSRAVGALVVVGGGGTPPDVVVRAIELSGGPNAVVVVLPQASASEAAGESTVEMFREAGARNVTNWRFAGSPGTEGLAGPWPSIEETAAAVSGADLVWFPGGSQGRLKRALDEAGLTDLIRARHREGAVVGGTSAGAAVLAEAMITGEQYDLEGVTTASTHIAEGLALWRDALIDQHFLKRQRNNRLLSAVLDHPQLIGVGIDERTAVIVRDGEFQVMGESAVIVFDARDADVVAAPAGAPAAATGIRTDVLTAGMSYRYRH